jgi:uncharacterized membrane protein YfcA
VIAGTLPGVFMGYYVRVLYLPDPRSFKLFVAFVLLYIGIRLLKDLFGGNKHQPAGAKALEDKFKARAAEVRKEQSSKIAVGIPAEAVVTTISISIGKVEYEFWGERFSFSMVGMFLLAFVVGIIGGAYGIGGGAIIAPFCVAFFHLPVYTIAGATLMATFITSVAGALFFTVLPATQGVSPAPDWPLGILFGIGGFVGMYLGAKTQKFMPQKAIRVIVGFAILFLAASYVIQFFR